MTLKKLLFLSILVINLSVISNMFGQVPPYIRVSTSRGSNLYMYFQSLDQIQSGITYTKFTRFEVYLDDDGDAGFNTWDMKFYSPTANFSGESGATLSLDKFELSSYYDGAFEYKKELTNISSTVLVDGGEEGAHYVEITYEVGVTNSLWNETPDHYYGQINFDFYSTW